MKKLGTDGLERGRSEEKLFGFHRAESLTRVSRDHCRKSQQKGEEASSGLKAHSVQCSALC